jgi:maltose O-acetyltransferase
MNLTRAVPLPTPSLSAYDGESTREFERMVSGEPYAAGDPYIRRLAAEGRARVAAINTSADDARRALLRAFFTIDPVAGRGAETKVWAASPFFCEYVRCSTVWPAAPVLTPVATQGFNITIGDNVYIGPGAFFLDVGPSTYLRPTHMQR